MTDLVREIQEGNKEARMWATRAMIEHYPDQYVALHKEEEQREIKTRKRELDLERATMIQAWKAPLDREAERTREIQEAFGSLSILDLKNQISQEKRRAEKRRVAHRLQETAGAIAKKMLIAERYLKNH